MKVQEYTHLPEYGMRAGGAGFPTTSESVSMQPEVRMGIEIRGMAPLARQEGR
jgi:hypothetical protein